MYLHRLEFQGIGPFPGRYVVDFDALGPDSLFLLEGPTGAGKSTIIDALTFALYGTTAASATSTDRLRSAFATPADETYVDLVVSVAAGTFRIRRSPEYRRSRKRGTGTTTEKARATLWRLSSAQLDALHGGELPEGEVLATQVSDASAQIAGVVGLSPAQFTQTVVLPQGEFATFLRAKSDDRAAILEKIFRTEIYQDIEQELLARAREHSAAVERATAQLETFSQAYSDALPVPCADEGREEPAPTLRERIATATADVCGVRAGGVSAVREITAEVDTAQEGILSPLVAARDEARAQAEELRSHHAAQVRLDQALRARAELQERRRDLAQHDEQIAVDTRRWAAAERAARVTPLLAALDRAAVQLDCAQRAAADARGEDAATSLSLAHGDDEALREARDAARAECQRLSARVGMLSDLAALEATLPAGREQIDAAAAELAQGRAHHHEERAAWDARPQQRATLVQELAEARALAATIGQATADHARATDIRTAAQAGQRQETIVQRAQDVLAQCTAQARAALREEKDLRQRRIDGIAGELAATLAPGSACAVCGSEHHPRLAAAAAGHPTPEQVAQAEEHRAAAEVAQTRAHVALSEQNATLTQFRERAEGHDATSAQREFRRTEAAVTLARGAQGRAATLEEQIERFDTQTASRLEELNATNVELRERGQRLRHEEDSWQEDRRRCTDARGEHASVAAALTDVRTRVARQTRIAGALEDALTARAQHRQAQTDLTQALQAEEFTDVDGARAAHLPADQRSRLRTAIETHQRETQRVADALEAPEIRALTGAEHADPASAKQAADQAAARAQNLTEQTARAQQRAEDVRQRGAHLLQQAGQHVELLRDAAPYVRLAALAGARGESLSQISLSTFVLLRRFEDMLVAANSRLQAMSAGRYELARTDRESNSRARHRGLGVEVIDYHSDSRRAPSTLSGGESFYVSLALALGLADVVRAEAGGIEIGTLLIDEGFGSLDQETLNVVLAELTHLRDSGRSIGLVSHVTEMKQMIPDRIEVSRLPGGGSALRVNWMEAGAG